MLSPHGLQSGLWPTYVWTYDIGDISCQVFLCLTLILVLLLWHKKTNIHCYLCIYEKCVLLLEVRVYTDAHTCSICILYYRFICILVLTYRSTFIAYLFVNMAQMGCYSKPMSQMVGSKMSQLRSDTKIYDLLERKCPINQWIYH